MNPRQIALAAAACLLLAGALVYGLSPVVPKIASEAPAPASGHLEKTAVPSSFVMNPFKPDEVGAPKTGPASQTVRQGDISPQRPQLAGRTRTEPTVQSNPAIAKTDQISEPSTADDSLEKTVENIPAQRPPVGLRLAPDVRLPVAAMPHDLKITPIAQQALDQIVSDYYQDLAAELKRGASGDAPVPLEESEKTGELTQVVTNGPAAESARARADYRFKALFGNAAYNRMTMRAVLESQLPVTPSE